MNRTEPKDPGKGLSSSTHYLLAHRAQSGALHYKEETGKLERVQWRPPRWWRLEHLSSEERLGQLDLFSLEQRRFQRQPPVTKGKLSRRCSSLEHSSSQQCIEGKETTGTNWKNRGSDWRNFLPMRTVEHCHWLPRGAVQSPPWRFLGLDYMKPWKARSDVLGTLLGAKGCTGHLLSSLPTCIVLWAYDSLIYNMEEKNPSV